MIYLILGAIIALIIVGALLEARHNDPKQRAGSPEGEGASAGDGDEAPGFASQLVANLRNSLSRLTGRQPSEQAQDFREWALLALEKEAAARAWVATLSDEGIEALTEQLASLCADLNMDLTWLLEDQLDSQADLKEALEYIAISFCLTCWKASLVQDEIEIFTVYAALDKQPNTKQHRQLSQQIYLALFDQGLVSVEMEQLLTLSDQERQDHIMNAIRNIANEDRERFNQVLRTVLWADPSQEATHASETQEAAAAV